MSSKSTITYTEDDLIAELRTLTRKRLRAWLREGLVRPRREAGTALYDEIDRARLELILTLSDDFDIGDDALSICFGYIDQFHSLRRELTHLISVIDSQPETVRQAILKAWRGEA